MGHDSSRVGLPARGGASSPCPIMMENMRLAHLAIALVIFAPATQAAGTDSVESLVRAVYDVISGPAGTRDWNRFRSLFADGARLIPVRVTADGPAPSVLTVDDYVKRAGANFEKSGFYESQIASRVETFGNIAHVFSTYESRHAADDPKPFARGINSIQLFNDGARWWVVTIYWDSERPGNEIPPRFLKRP